MRWFGEPWPNETERAPYCEDDAFRTGTPVGEPCGLCAEEIVEGNRGEFLATGEPAHVECLLRTVMGNHIHVAGECEYAGQCNEKSDLTYREEALKVWEMING